MLSTHSNFPAAARTMDAGWRRARAAQSTCAQRTGANGLLILISGRPAIAVFRQCCAVRSDVGHRGAARRVRYRPRRYGNPADTSQGDQQFRCCRSPSRDGVPDFDLYQIAIADAVVCLAKVSFGQITMGANHDSIICRSIRRIAQSTKRTRSTLRKRLA